jgi:hypothetical protein
MGFRGIHAVNRYDGTQDPETWIMMYEIAVRAVGGGEDVMANYFPVLLDQASSRWLLALPEEHLYTWEEVKNVFIATYKTTCKQSGTKYDLERLRLRNNESLREYIRRFSEKRLTIPDITEEECISAFTKGLVKNGNAAAEELRKKLHRNKVKTMARLLEMATMFAGQDEAEYIFRKDYAYASNKRDRSPPRGDKKADERHDQSRPNDSRRDEGRVNSCERRRDRFRCNEVNNVKTNYKKKNLNVQGPIDKLMRGDCPIHPGTGHTLVNYRHFNAEFDAEKKKQKVDAGKAEEPVRPPPRRPNNDDDDEDVDPKHRFRKEDGVMHMIMGGHFGCENKRSSKVSQREVLSLKNISEGITEPVWVDYSHQTIVFSRDDQWCNNPYPGRFPLVLDPVIGRLRFERVLIDGGNALNMLFKNSMVALGISEKDLQHYPHPFWGILPGESSVPLGQITLRVQFGTEQHHRIQYMPFVVTNFESAYHAIIGRPGLTKLMAVPHYGYLVLKIPTDKGVLTCKANVHVSYVCEKEGLDKRELIPNTLRLEEMAVPQAEVAQAAKTLPLLTSRFQKRREATRPPSRRRPRRSSWWSATPRR